MFRGFLGLLRPLVLLTVVILGLLPAAAGAVIQPTLELMIPPPVLRTPQEMEAAAAAEAAGPPRPLQMKPFRPTMNGAIYRQLKARAARNQAPAPAPPQAPLAPLAATTLTSTINFDGVQFGNSPGQAGLYYPPDTEGAVGLNHFVEITNSHLDIYLKATPNTRVNGNGNGMSLGAFFGYFTKGLFDPRVIFDPVAQRWIVSADAFAESSKVQRFFFAVSQTADPTGAFFIYQVNVSDGNGVANGVEWDFPQAGMDQNAVIFTANFFNKAGNFVDARMFTVAKSLLYSGPSQTVIPTKLFTGLLGTLSAPIVLDANPNTYLVAPDSSINTNKVEIYTLTNSAANPPTLIDSGTIANVPTYSVPLNAPQPGTPDQIDTSDVRFVNAGTQIGNSLFQVHSISITPTAQDRAICRFYEFDTVHKTVIQYGDFSRSGTSYDFNASIAANRHKDVFVTWSATDTTVNAEVRFSGRLHTDPAGVIPSPGSLLFASTTALTGNPVSSADSTQRWGDYSAVSLDPADHTGGTAWIVNEKIVDTSTWGSRIGRISLPRQFGLPAVDLLLLGN